MRYLLAYLPATFWVVVKVKFDDDEVCTSHFPCLQPLLLLLFLFLSPWPGHRLPLVGARSRRCGSQPVPFICCCCVRGLPPAAVVRGVSMAAMALRPLRLRGFVRYAYFLGGPGAALRWLLECLGAVSLGAGPLFPSKSNISCIVIGSPVLLSLGPVPVIQAGKRGSL